MSQLEQILNSHPLARFLVIEAVSRYADEVAQTQPSDYPPRWIFSPESWIDTAKGIQEILRG